MKIRDFFPTVKITFDYRIGGSGAMVLKTMIFNKEICRYIITAAEWQQYKTIEEYIKARQKEM